MRATRCLRYFTLAMLLAAMAGCGATLSYDSGQLNANRSWADWDPLAEPIAVPNLDDALAHSGGLEFNGRTVIALDVLNQPDAAVQQALVLRDNAGMLELWAREPLPDVALYVEYDPQREHPVVLDADRPGALSMALVAEPGLIAIGVAGIRDALLDPRLPLARLSFAPGAGPALAKRASITQEERSKVRDLTAVNNGDGSATLQWSERHTGDYDLNGLVSVADLARVGQKFNERYNVGDPDWAQLEVIDGDENTQIFLPDLVPLAVNFNSRILGYNVYRTPLASPDEVPDVNQSARWTKVLNISEPTGPSAPRVWSGQNFRLVYTFIDNSGEGDFGWYVTPAGPATDVPPEGPKCDPATLTVIMLPSVGLSFEIMPPAGSTVNVNDEFYLAVKVTGVTGLFSANVRFEYDTTLVQYMEGVSTYDVNLNFLDPPLVFLAHDYGTGGSGSYSLVGFNDTQTQGTPAKDGDGYLGYFKFKALAAGTNAACFRFPQVSNYIYLWGVQYGVPIATPSLGAAQNLVVQ